jgi:acetyl esterase/lipase
MGVWCASMNYRFAADGYTYRDNLADIRWCIDSLELRTGCRKFIIIGGSAGATLSMNYACQMLDPRVVKVVSIAGAYNFSANDIHLTVLVKGRLYAGTDWAAGSPITYAAQCPSTILIHGALDDLISWKQAHNMYLALKQAGRDVDGFLRMNLGHSINQDQQPLLAFLILSHIRKQ